MSSRADTLPEAARIWEEVLRSMPAQQKWRMLAREFRTGRQLHALGFQRRDTTSSGIDRVSDWMRLCYGFVPNNSGQESGMSDEVDNLGVLLQVTAILDRLGIPYALGGSMASSLHGVPRFTLDADLTVEPFPGKEAAFVASLGPEFYVNLAAVEQAVAQRSSFNLIQTVLGFKIDIFVQRDRPFELSAMQRRISMPLPDSKGQHIEVLAAEDIVLHKLEWYRLGSETSDRQWADLVGVLRTQAGHLDQNYLEHWAEVLGLSDLLARARLEIDSKSRA